MLRNPFTLHRAKIWIVLLLAGTGTLHAQQIGRHEVTLYAFPTMQPFDWDSPSTLYKTAKHCFYKTISLKDTYLLGHMAISLSTPLLQQPKFIAMTSANKMQRVNLILKDKIGLAILGATLEGKVESEEHLLHMIQVYAERKKLAYITFCVSEAAMARMLEFITSFTRTTPGDVQPSMYYGGAYWPLYENEGAGCSAFALSVLASANLLPAEGSIWLKNVTIPMRLIGGEYHENKRIPFGRIRRSKSWYQGEGKPNVDFVNVQTYDPSLLYHWIIEKGSLRDSVYRRHECNGVPGLIVDCTSQILPIEKPYYKKREVPNLFLDIYRQKLLQHASKPTP